jgi:hypothetical protein
MAEVNSIEAATEIANHTKGKELYPELMQKAIEGNIPTTDKNVLFLAEQIAKTGSVPPGFLQDIRKRAEKLKAGDAAGMSVDPGLSDEFGGLLITE